MIVCVLYCSVCLHNDKTHAVNEHYLATAPDGLLFSSAFKSLVNVRMSANLPDPDLTSPSHATVRPRNYHKWKSNVVKSYLIPSPYLVSILKRSQHL